jgi:hypothetical protein
MASVTITTTAPDDARLSPAFGAKLGLVGGANTAQVKAHLIAYMRQVVQDYEREQAIKALSAVNFDPT